MKTPNNQNQDIPEIQPEQDMEQKPKKEFNMYLAVAKVFIFGFCAIAVLFTAKAAFTDTVLESLENSYNSSTNMHDKQIEAVRQANDMERLGADNVCNNYKALKAYKESKKLPLKNDYNPCVSLAAPQEGF